MFKNIYKIFLCLIILVFLTGQICPFPPSKAYAQNAPVSSISGLNLPVPGTMITLTPGYRPALIKGVKIYPEQPFRFDFFIDIGDAKLKGKALEDESTRLVKYFLASLTTPEDELWVNLSPYEKDRIITKDFGETEMGRDLLSQDYILKQLTASLIYPEEELGREFWDKVYQKANEKYGTTDISINTFNKVWIVPDDPIVYQDGDQAYVIESKLKVMLEEDYLALRNNLNEEEIGTDHLEQQDVEELSNLSSEAIKEIILPAIEKEVNEGKNFAQLRQVQNSLVLAIWYKKTLQESLLAGIYADKNKTKGIDLEDKKIKEKIYQQYLEAFKKGVYDYIKEDYDVATQQISPKKYFSGGYTTISERGNLKERTRVVMNLYEAPIAAREGFVDYVDGVGRGKSNVVNVSVSFSRVEDGAYYRDDKIREVMKQRYKKQERAKGRDITKIEEEIQFAGSVNQDLDVKPDDVTEDGIKVFVDDFEFNHVGRDRRAVYARSQKEVAHKLEILRLWEQFVADQESMDADEARKVGFRTYIINWVNNVEDKATKLKRQNLLIKAYFEIEAEGLKVDKRYEEARKLLSQIPVLHDPLENVTLDFFIAGPGAGQQQDYKTKFENWRNFVRETPAQIGKDMADLDSIVDRIGQKAEEKDQNNLLLQQKITALNTEEGELSDEKNKPIYWRILPRNKRKREAITKKMEDLREEIGSLQIRQGKISQEINDLLEDYPDELGAVLEQGFNQYNSLEESLTAEERLYAEFNDRLIGKSLMPELEELQREGKMTSELVDEYLKLAREHLKEGKEALRSSRDWKKFSDEDRERVRK